ncbi:hypothetical protein V2G26_015987 [Clonostachys chloroleuca]
MRWHGTTAGASTGYAASSYASQPGSHDTRQKLADNSSGSRPPTILSTTSGSGQSVSKYLPRQMRRMRISNCTASTRICQMMVRCPRPTDLLVESGKDILLVHSYRLAPALTATQYWRSLSDSEHFLLHQRSRASGSFKPARIFSQPLASDSW